MILNDNQIRARCEWTDQPPMISPYTYAQCRAHVVVDNPLKLSSQTVPVISYGQSSYGYDIRLGRNLQIFTRLTPDEIDPKAFNDNCIDELDLESPCPGVEYFTLPQFGSALGHSVETLHLPDDIFALCVGKSTYARCGLIVNTTPLEPGWRGQLVIEIHNTTPLPIRVYANEGIAQLVFFKGDRPAVTYGDRAGKYQNQTGITTARI